MAGWAFHQQKSFNLLSTCGFSSSPSIVHLFRARKSLTSLFVMSLNEYFTRNIFHSRLRVFVYEFSFFSNLKPPKNVEWKKLCLLLWLTENSLTRVIHLAIKYFLSNKYNFISLSLNILHDYIIYKFATRVCVLVRGKEVSVYVCVKAAVTCLRSIKGEAVIFPTCGWAATTGKIKHFPRLSLALQLNVKDLIEKNMKISARWTVANHFSSPGFHSGYFWLTIR